MIHCIHCGLVYVGETGRSLRSRMNGHRSAIKKGGQSLLHRHFHQPNHSVDDMRVQILEKIYHSSESPSWSTPLRRERELFWIKELPLQKSQGCHKLVAGQPRDCMQELQAGGKHNFAYRLVASLPSVSTV